MNGGVVLCAFGSAECELPQKLLLDFASECAILFGACPAPCCRESRRFAKDDGGGVVLPNGSYLKEDGTVTKTKPTDNYAYYKDGVLTLHNYDYSGEGLVSEEGTALVDCASGYAVSLEGENYLSTPIDGSVVYRIASGA